MAWQIVVEGKTVPLGPVCWPHVGMALEGATQPDLCQYTNLITKNNPICHAPDKVVQNSMKLHLKKPFGDSVQEDTLGS
jgi:hypothetical protein